MGRRLVVCHISRIDDGAVVVLPRDGIFVYRRVVFGGVGRLARHRRDFGIPARERVGELRRRGLRRRLAGVFGRRAVAERLCREFRAALVLPRHVIGAERSRVFGGIRRVGGNQLELRSPAREVVVVLRRRRQCRQRAVVGRHRASLKVGVRLERRAVRVLPHHRVGGAVRRGYDDILDPATVLAYGAVAVLRISPLQDMFPRIDRCRIGRPIGLRAADIGFMIGVHIEMQFVPTILGRGLPLEGNVAGTRDGDSRPRISTVAYLARSDAAVLKPRPRLLASGVDFVEAVLLDPAGIERGVGGDVHGIRQSVARPWSQGPVASIALTQPVQRREFAHIQLPALLHIARLDSRRALVVQLARDGPRIERRDDEVPYPAAVVFSVHAAILTVHPSQDMVLRILERQRNNRPIGTLAADAAMLHSVHIEHQRVAVSLRRGLPLEGKDAWTGKRRLQPCVLVAFDCARAQRPLAGVEEPFGGAACGTHGGHRAEDRRIGGIALYFRNFRRPPHEQIFEVSIARFRQTGMGRQKAVFDACRVNSRAVVALPCHVVGLEVGSRRERQSVIVVRVFLVEAQEARNLADRSVVAAALAYDFERIGAFRRDNSLDAVNNRDRPAIAGGSADGRAKIIGVVVRVACVCRDRAAADENIAARASAGPRTDRRRIIAACVGQGFCRDVAAGYGYVAAFALIVTCADG